MLIECIAHFSIHYHCYQRLSHTIRCSPFSPQVFFILFLFRFAFALHGIICASSCAFAREFMSILTVKRCKNFFGIAHTHNVTAYVIQLLFQKDKMKETDFISLRTLI